jgi:hypothetical protein
LAPFTSTYSVESMPRISIVFRIWMNSLPNAYLKVHRLQSTSYPSAQKRNQQNKQTEEKTNKTSKENKIK